MHAMCMTKLLLNLKLKFGDPAKFFITDAPSLMIAVTWLMGNAKSFNLLTVSSRVFPEVMDPIHLTIPRFRVFVLVIAVTFKYLFPVLLVHSSIQTLNRTLDEWSVLISLILVIFTSSSALVTILQTVAGEPIGLKIWFE